MGGQKLLCPSLSQSRGGHVQQSPLKLGPQSRIAGLRSTYHHLACEHQSVCEDNEVIINYMK